MSPADCHLYLLFDPRACLGDPWQTLHAAIAGGVDLVQWRTKGRDDELLPRALASCHSRGVPLVVNDDLELAATSGADGVHLGQDDAPVAAARARLGQRWIGVSTHDLAQLDRAHRDGADCVGFGPCYPTATKGYQVGLPATAVRAACAASRVPLFAIGGIDALRAAELRQLGVRRVAVGNAILGASDPELAARAIRTALLG